TEGTQLALVADVVPTERRGAAYGWYYLAIGVGALPASIGFGIIWDRFGSRVAFTVGAWLAAFAAVGLLLVPTPSQQQRLPGRLYRSASRCWMNSASLSGSVPG